MQREEAAAVTAPPPGTGTGTGSRTRRGRPGTTRRRRSGSGSGGNNARGTPTGCGRHPLHLRRIRSSVPPTLIRNRRDPYGYRKRSRDLVRGDISSRGKVADDSSRSNPLITKGTAKRIADRVKKRFDHLDRKAIQKAVDAFFEAVRGARQGPNLLMRFPG